jgi:hypothetical protein
MMVCAAGSSLGSPPEGDPPKEAMLPTFKPAPPRSSGRMSRLCRLVGVGRWDRSGQNGASAGNAQKRLNGSYHCWA